MTFKQMTKKHINDEQIFSNLEKYVNLIEKYNKVMNLTGFKNDKLWEEGILESIISLETAFGKNVEGKLLDIGAGAGFPSVPYLIANPNLKLSIFEPQQKRIKFLDVVKNELALQINLINVRVEDYKNNEEFDFVTARAVTSLKNLLQAGSHVAKINGIFGFIKGPLYKEELHEARWVIKELDYEPEIIPVNLTNKQTWIIKMKKNVASSSKYPMLWRDIVK